MIKKKFSELKKGDIFYMPWDNDEYIACMKIGCYYEDLPYYDECKECDYYNNAVWLDYKSGTLDWCPENLMVWADEEN